MMKLLSPADLKALHEQWAHLPGNCAMMRMGVVNWLSQQMAEKAADLTIGNSIHPKIGLLPGPAREALIGACGSEDLAIETWCRVVYDVLTELGAIGWGVRLDSEEMAWEVSFHVFGPCPRHGLPVDPVVGGCTTCLAELPRLDPAAIQLAVRTRAVH